jgi:hypothetical protein
VSYRTEFPDFDYYILPIMGFTDESWHNDHCPRFEHVVNEELKLVIWFDYIDKAHLVGKSIFTVVEDHIGETTELLSTDDQTELVGWIDNYFAELKLV